MWWDGKDNRMFHQLLQSLSIKKNSTRMNLFLLRIEFNSKGKEMEFQVGEGKNLGRLEKENWVSKKLKQSLKYIMLILIRALKKTKSWRTLWMKNNKNLRLRNKCCMGFHKRCRNLNMNWSLNNKFLKRSKQS
jgi:hypothetical protein